MNSYLRLLAFLFLHFIFILPTYAAKLTATPASCTFSVSNGWTQTISYKCASSVDLNGATIQFNVDNPAGLTNLSSVWGFNNLSSYPLNPILSLSGNTVTLALKFPNATILSAGTTTNFSYSTNNNVNVSGMALYPAGSSPSSASLNISLPTTQPTDVSSNSIIVNVLDSTNTNHPVSVAWGGQGTLTGLVAASSYSLSANPITGQKNQYQFTFSPSTITLQSGQNNVMVNVTVKPIPTGIANVSVSGLPTGTSTTLNFNYTVGTQSQTISFPNVANGSQNYTLPTGSYSLSAQNVIANSFLYSVTSVPVTIQTGITTTISLPFKQSATGAAVRGWPNYIAMGAVTDDTAGTTTALQTRPVDAIFKYAGLGGNGDPGQIIYPIFTLETMTQAQTLTSFYQKNAIAKIVVPVMVVYTAQMSGGTSFTDFTFQNLVMHYISLIINAQKMEQFKSSQTTSPGAIILNPDLFGMIQQESLLPSLNSAISQVSLNNALKIAICFVTSTINTQYGNSLNYEALFKAINATTDLWSAMSIWDTFKMQYYNTCTSNPIIPASIAIPGFTNDFPGWIQSTNWLMKQFAPDITFGWQENIWSIGSANWVHQNYTSANLQTQIINPTLAAIVSTTAYSGAYRPDFLVFDKYEMDAIPGATGIGYLFNARDMTNYLAYIKGISQGLANIPVMLWQIPGGHLQTINDIDTRNSNASTESDFFFGDTVNPLSNLKSYITSIQLPTSPYGVTSMTSYLGMSPSGTLGGYTWQVNNMQQAAASHVFAILWGGGNTTSVGTFPTNDGGVLANRIINYYKNPMPLG